MKQPLCLFFILLYLSITQGIYDFIQLATGNGILQAIQLSDNSVTFAETQDFCPSCQEQLWELYTDSRFPNGVFIRSAAYPTLVWDSQGGKAVAGNPIVLYERKNSLADTKNQRWVPTSLNHFSLIMNQTFVAKWASSHLTLAVSNKSDSAQTFYQIQVTNVSSVTVVNYLSDPISIAFSSIAGPYGGLQEQFGFLYTVPTGARLSIRDSNGVLLYNTTIYVASFLIGVPAVHFPVGPHQYSGYSTDGSTGASLTLTFSGVGNTSEGLVTGSGTDSFGAFTVTQGNYNLAWYVNFMRQYDGVGHYCTGKIEATGTIISGTWQNVASSTLGSGNFQYTVVA